MPYQTGSAASFAALKTEIMSFLSANGWTQETDIIKKNGVFAKITTGTHYESDAYIRLEGGKSSDGSGNLIEDWKGPPGVTLTRNVAMMNAGLGLGAANGMVFPITYYFHLASSPVDEFWCFIQFNGDRCQHMGFGNINKSAPFTGGAFYTCSTVEASASNNTLYLFSSNGLIANPGLGSTSPSTSRAALELIPFHGGKGTDNHCFSGSMLHAEVGGLEWYTSSYINPGATTYPGNEYMIAGAREAAAMRQVSESTVNGMPNLIPFNLRVRDEGNNIQPIGYLENIRFCQISLLGFGQVESDGTDSWKFYPLYLKNAGAPNGGQDHTGTMGLAVRYDGP